MGNVVHFGGDRRASIWDEIFNGIIMSCSNNGKRRVASSFSGLVEQLAAGNVVTVTVRRRGKNGSSAALLS